MKRVMKILCTPLLFCAAALAQSNSVTVFQHARIIDGTGRPPLTNASLVVTGERITGVNVAFPKNANIIELKGKTIIPGFINAHGHLGVVQGATTQPGNFTRQNVADQLDQYARYGVTSMLALGLATDLIYDIRDDQKRDDLFFRGATIYTAGRGIGAPYGAPPMNVGQDQVYRPTTAEEARAAVREMAAHHPDIIKIWVDDVGGTMPKMQPEIYKAVIDESHKNHLRVAAHEYYLADAKALVDAGVDVLAHSIRDADVDAALIDAMKSRGVYYIPTLELDESFYVFADHPEWLQDQFLARALSPEVRALLASPDWRDKIEHDPKMGRNRQAFATARKNLKALSDAGVNIAMGTDSGATPVRIQGFAEHLELVLMNEAGVNPMRALVSATASAAAVAGVKDRGTIAAGSYADFLVLDADPLVDIRNTRKMSAIWHNGRPVNLAVLNESVSTSKTK